MDLDFIYSSCLLDCCSKGMKRSMTLSSFTVRILRVLQRQALGWVTRIEWSFRLEFESVHEINKVNQRTLLKDIRIPWSPGSFFKKDADPLAASGEATVQKLYLIAYFCFDSFSTYQIKVVFQWTSQTLHSNHYKNNQPLSLILKLIRRMHFHSRTSNNDTIKSKLLKALLCIARIHF